MLPTFVQEIGIALVTLEAGKPQNKWDIRDVTGYSLIVNYFLGKLSEETLRRQLIACGFSMIYADRIKAIGSGNLTRLSPPVEKPKNYFGFHWSYAEDTRLIAGVYRFGKNWQKIADFVGSRKPNELITRWNAITNEKNEITHWTPDQDKLIFDAVSEFGFQWEKISRLFANKSLNECKNHWNCLSDNSSVPSSPTIWKKLRSRKEYEGFCGQKPLKPKNNCDCERLPGVRWRGLPLPICDPEVVMFDDFNPMAFQQWESKIST